MNISELKFVLKLLNKEGYLAAITELKPNSKTPTSERDRICRDLRDHELVACSYEISKFKIASPGKALLKLDAAELPVTPQELKVLKACQEKTITPGKTGIPATERQSVIQRLADRGLIQVDKKDKKIKEVWLTERGKRYLLEEYDPSGGGNITLTKSMLADYLRFLRRSLPPTPPKLDQKPSDEEILQLIRNLDRELGTGNYLPIFHLREKLQPPLSREELDQSLYRLQRQDKIDLSSLQEAGVYRPEQIDAGISQNVGGPLFFITVN